MISSGFVKVDKVPSKWFFSHFDSLQASNGAASRWFVKVDKVNFSRT